MKLLLIEDEEDLANALAKGLQKQGYLVDVANDGEEALDFYYGTIYDLIILDLNLPKIDGLEILDMIRKENKEIKIIITSARGAIDQKILGLDNGANELLEKIWDDKDYMADIVKVHVSTLRKKLRDEFGVDFIEYVQKIGYRFKEI
ncbi:MAG: response regulator [Anaerorhabdus sp.]|uniref:response regulator n=1 Tax=Anaerorhabdus sp. TaxID=1872524 RepID=UPI003A83FDB5